MAVAPLFVKDMPTLKGSLRLTGAASPDVLTLIDVATKSARIVFYRRLDTDRIAQILGFGAEVDNPGTANEYMRATASLTEVLLVRKYLLRILPTRFLDGSGDAHQSFQDEAPFRDLTPDKLTAELTEIDEQLEANFKLLEGDDDIPETSTIGAVAVAPLCKPARIGATLGLLHGDGVIQTSVNQAFQDPPAGDFGTW